MRLRFGVELPWGAAIKGVLCGGRGQGPLPALPPCGRAAQRSPQQWTLCCRFSLALSCKELYAHAQACGAWAADVAVSTPRAASAPQFLRWARPRRHLIRSLTRWEPFHPGERGITAANLAMLRGLAGGGGGGGRSEPLGRPSAAATGAAGEAAGPALERLVWNLTPNACLLLPSGIWLPSLQSLTLDFLDPHDVVAHCALGPGFGSALPALSALALCNLAVLRLAPGCLPASLRSLSFENAYCPGLVPTVAGAAARATALGALRVHNMERRGMALSLHGVEVGGGWSRGWRVEGGGGGRPSAREVGKRQRQRLRCRAACLRPAGRGAQQTRFLALLPARTPCTLHCRPWRPA